MERGDKHECMFYNPMMEGNNFCSPSPCITQIRTTVVTCSHYNPCGVSGARYDLAWMIILCNGIGMIL